MRATMMIRRQRSTVDEPSGVSSEPKLVGAEATQALADVDGISAVRIETQFGDRAIVSYEAGEQRMDFARIDAALQSKGMHRLQ